MGYLIHPSVTIGPCSKIGRDTTLQANCTVGKSVAIGKSCFIHAGVQIPDHVRIGDRVVIFGGVKLATRMHIEKNVEIGNDVIFAESAKRTVVYESAHIGQGCQISGGVSIGPHCIIGANAVINSNVPGYALISAYRGEQLGWVCLCGERLDLIDNSAMCASCRKIYFLRDGILRPG